MVKKHQIFEGRRFRGSLSLLEALSAIAIESTAAYIRGEGGGAPFGQVEGFGNWQHKPFVQGP